MYKISQFILTPAQRNQSTLEVYVAQPDANKEALAGKLFALFEIETIAANGLKIINFLVSSLNHHYYQNEKMILRERVSSVKVEHIFESALAKTNKKLAEFLQEEKIKLQPDILNITIGVIYNNNLHFASLGKNKALLIYKNKAEEDAKYKLADITRQTADTDAKKPASAVKLFSNVISGTLPKAGYFIFANETFSEYLSDQQIINIITTLPPAGAAEQIKNTLSKINAYVPFLGIIIKNTVGLEMDKIKDKEPAPSTKSSIETLVGTEEKTEKLLTPSGLINTKKLPSFFNKLAGRLPLNQSASGQAFILKDKIFAKKKSVWISFKKILGFLKKLSLYLISLIIHVLKILTNKQKMMEARANINKAFKGVYAGTIDKTKNFITWYKGLSKINKGLLTAFVACLVILAASLGAQSVKNKNLKNQEEISTAISAIEQKQNQIEASLLYNNEAGANKLLTEVKDLLDKLPRQSQSQIDKFAELEAKYNVQREKASKVIKLSPAELANFANINSNASPKNIILAEGKIYSGDAGQSSVYVYDQKNKLTTTINAGSETLRLDYPSLDKNNNVSYLGNNKIITVDVKNSAISSLELSYNGALNKIFDARQYNNRFYFGDAAANQIIRYSKSGSRLANSTAWLNENVDLSKAISLDIDGNVYVLKNNGELLKYVRGKKENFSLSPIEPALSQASKIMVSQDGNFLYIFDQSANRLAVFSKDGKFVCQYASDKFNNLRDFTIDEKNKKAYFLNGTIVYAADLTHIK